MTWRGPRSRGNDHLLHGVDWSKIKAYYRTVKPPRCARCGCALDWDGTYMINGKCNPRYPVVGHRVSRVVARSLGWTDQQINDLSNTQIECKRCSDRSGARSGQRIQRSALAKNKRIVTGQKNASGRLVGSWY